MQITLIISSLAAGGAERVMSELANAWVSRGHKISIITFSDPNTDPFYHLDERIHLHQLNQLVYQTVSLPRRLKNLGNRILKLRRAIKIAKPHIVISFVDVTNITTLLACIGLRIPTIVCERTHPQHYQLPALYNRLRLITYSWADKIISQTASASAYFSKIPNDKKVVIPNCVRKPQYQKQEADALQPIQKIISVGRLCPNKGFATLIKAFSEIARKNPGITLTIYGEGLERRNLEALIQELNLMKRALLPGTVQDIELAMYEADLFVFPSHYEGFPNALCEAMATGLPVIASRCSGNIDIIREGIDGRLFEVGDVVQLIRVLEELIEDAPQRTKLSKEALKLPDRFSESFVLQKWDDLLAEVVPFPKA